MNNMYKLPALTLDSKVAQLVVELESLRTKRVHGTTPPWIFFGIKDLYQTIESVISARIEGNYTTISEYVDAAREVNHESITDEHIKMILNIENGITNIESQDMAKTKIDRRFILDLHRQVVGGLDPTKEGDSRPGAYRNTPRAIANSNHILPMPSDIQDLMDGLINLINLKVPHQLDLIKIAVVHHRFVWIHPFGNGNGRVVRLLTYAMLAKLGYIDKNGARLLDPTAVFGTNKFKYYDMLSDADDLSEKGLIAWCEYMLDGLNKEVGKIDQLLDGDFTKNEIILPAIEYSYDKQRLNDIEYKMLLICVDEEIVTNSSFKPIFPANTSHVTISQAIKKLKDQNLIRPVEPNARKYTIVLNRNPLTSGVLRSLDNKGYLPPTERGES